MPSTSNIFFISAFLCIAMLLVWCSLLHTGIAGVKEWTLANILGFVSFLLYAFGRELPPVLAYEAADAVYAAAGAAVLVGFRRFLGRGISLYAVGASVALLAALIAAFHYGYDSYALRTLIIAVFQVAVSGGIILAVYPSLRTSRSPYPALFTLSMALIVAIGHAVRGAIHMTGAPEVTSLLQPAGVNLFFLSAGSLMLPVLTLGALMMVHDTKIARAEHAANRDFLTGAWSRRAFFELAERELAQARRKQRPLALLLIDIDHFKRINDSHGHATGDQVLVDLVLRVETLIRSVDYFARIGGEEFAALLPETERAAALMVAERMRATLARDSSRHGRIGYTVSIGLAMLRPPDTLHELMRRADAALYQAKAAGRNKVVCESL